MNILAKRSPLSLSFRVYSRCLAFCILKRIKLIDGIYTTNDDLESTSNFSTSPGRFNPSESGEQLVFNQQLKQAAYQYNLIFQTKVFKSVEGLEDISKRVSEYLKQIERNNEDENHFNLAGIILLNADLMRMLFKDKYFLF